MKSAILATVDQEHDRYIASAFGREGEIACGVGSSEAIAMRRLDSAVRAFLDTQAMPWLESLQHAGGEETSNCGHGTLKLPIDLWHCKLLEKPCPIHAQVFLDDQPAFFRGCLADEETKKGIFRAATDGRYGGFKHMVGRSPCQRCEVRVRRGNEKHIVYFYPWELSCLKHFTPLVSERDLASVMRSASRFKLRGSYALRPLCASCARTVTEALYPDVAKKLRIIKRNVYRPEPRREQPGSSA